MVGAGVVFALWAALGIVAQQLGDSYKVLVGLLFWVSWFLVRYCFRRSGLDRWLDVSGRWIAIGVLLFAIVVWTQVAFTDADNGVKFIAGALAFVAVCFADYLSGQRTSRAVARWLGAALIRLGVMLNAVVSRIFGRTQ